MPNASLRIAMKLSHHLIRDQICEALRSKIIGGEFAAGESLKEETLATEFGVSRTPMRQALFALEEQGYLLKKERHGFEVQAPPSDGDSRRRASQGVASFKAPTLREQAANRLREGILSGQLEAGAVLREAHLAAEFGISRTPLREGLLTLAREGLAQKEPRRGFRVSPLEAREVRELYPLRALLEAQALRESGIPDPGAQISLERLNERLRQEPAGLSWVRLDNEWHELLVASCSNRHLRKILQALREHSLRYEVAFLQASPDSRMSTAQHQDILASLKDGDLERACQTLAANMTISMKPLLAWLERNPG